jgi:hypothetical protein
MIHRNPSTHKHALAMKITMYVKFVFHPSKLAKKSPPRVIRNVYMSFIVNVSSNGYRDQIRHRVQFAERNMPILEQMKHMKVFSKRYKGILK